MLSIATTAAGEFLAMLLKSSTEESATDCSDDHTVRLDITLSIRNDTNHWPVGVPLPMADDNVTLTCSIVCNNCNKHVHILYLVIAHLFIYYTVIS